MAERANPVELGALGAVELGAVEAWRRLASHLAWASGPSVSFVFSDDPAAADPLRDRSVALVEAAGGRVRVLQPSEPLALREIVRDVMSHQPQNQADLVWLQALSDGPAWLDAWDDVLQRLNERRERLRTSLGGALVCCAPTALKAKIRERAPDLWSIRSLALDLAPVSARVRPEVRTNAYRIAEALLRTRFHQRMRKEPWFALVLGDDPVPRRRLRDELVSGGARLLVHLEPSEALTKPTEADMHWVLAERDLDLAFAAVLSGTSKRGLSRPVLVEGDLSLERALLTHAPELYATAAFVVHLGVERAFAPSPLPVLGRTEGVVQQVWEALDEARAAELSADPHVLNPSQHGPKLGVRAEGKLRGKRIRALVRAAEALIRQGWTTEAAPCVSEAFASAEELRASDPDAVWLRAETEELAARLAQRMGDRMEALEHFSAAIPLRRKLARTSGGQRLRRRAELAQCLSKAGELSLTVGAPAEAERNLREALAIRRRLLRFNDDREALSDLATSWSYVGDLELATHEAGDKRLGLATDAYREALRLRERVAGEEGSARFRRLLSVALGRLARALTRSGDLAGARSHAERAVGLADTLCAEDPGNADWRMEASVAHTRLGDVLRATGASAAAAEAYAEAAILRERLVAEEPGNARWQEYLVVVLGRLIEAKIGLGDAAAAHAASLRAVSLSEALAWSDPVHLSWRRGLAMAWVRHGDVSRACGHADEGSRSWHQALEVARGLSSAGPEGVLRAKEVVRALEARGFDCGRAMGAAASGFSAGYHHEDPV